MLVLSRKLNQEIHIGENIVVRVLEIRGNQVRLGIVAPPEVPVLREEIRKTMALPECQSTINPRVTKEARC